MKNTKLATVLLNHMDSNFGEIGIPEPHYPVFR